MDRGSVRGNLMVISRPRGEDRLDDEIAAWKRAGIGVMASLLERSEAAELELSGEPEAANSKGIHFISFPIPDRGIPTSQMDAVSLFTKISDLLGRGQNVGIHCRQGVGRSGLIATGVLVRSGVDVDEALKTVSAARGVRVPETEGQLEWIRQLPF